MQPEDSWREQITTWRFEEAWPQGQVTVVNLPIGNGGVVLSSRDGVIAENEDEGYCNIPLTSPILLH